jgi:peptide/nickel transport system ATP-binding protein
MGAPIIDVQNLRMYYKLQTGYVHAVDDVNFTVEERLGLGLAGESGCGKTSIAITLLKILPQNARIISGKIIFNGRDIIPIDENTLRKEVRWKGISLIFQGAMNALNPLYKVEDQITEAIRLHEPETPVEEARERVKKLFELVGMDPARSTNHPHEFSGGMRQRACIAMALACNPKFLIADEPGTALDVIVQAQTLKLLRELKEKLNLAMMVISHDLSIIAETCEKVAIMYAGNIVEYGSIVSIFKEPLHPYTQELIRAFPSISSERTKLTYIPGSPPDLLNPPKGCRFNPRCRYAIEICRKEPPQLLETSSNHLVSCHLVNKR